MRVSFRKSPVELQDEKFASERHFRVRYTLATALILQCGLREAGTYLDEIVCESDLRSLEREHETDLQTIEHARPIYERMLVEHEAAHPGIPFPGSLEAEVTRIRGFAPRQCTHLEVIGEVERPVDAVGHAAPRTIDRDSKEFRAAVAEEVRAQLREAGFSAPPSQPTQDQKAAKKS